jgi:phosphoribosylglycinamide formyltransferase-1
MSHRKETLISEEVVPVPGSGLVSTATRGEPALPSRFTWRGTEYRITAVLNAWKTTGPCSHGSGELYVRRHWYTVSVEPPCVMTLYFDRQARQTRRPKARWWLYTISTEDPPVGSDKS